MYKVSYNGNGETTNFSFNIPYYESTNIVVKKNNTTATGYTIVGISNGENADIPYSGGTVIFETAPSVTDTVTIQRELPLTRTVDYQPTAKINPTTLNQDLNYLIELLKNLNDDLDWLHAQYTDIADKDSTTILLERIAAISEQIIALGNISNIRENITTLDVRTSGLIDYVIETQAPTAENGYTWYRKYKSGWVEQGGHANSSENGTVCNFPITMQDTNYSVQVTVSGESPSNFSTSAGTKNQAYITISTFTEVRQCDWRVSGFAAA